jgi:hypothetical protein
VASSLAPKPSLGIPPWVRLTRDPSHVNLNARPVQASSSSRFASGSPPPPAPPPLALCTARDSDGAPPHRWTRPPRPPKLTSTSVGNYSSNSAAGQQHGDALATAPRVPGRSRARESFPFHHRKNRAPESGRGSDSLYPRQGLGVFFYGSTYRTATAGQPRQEDG